MLVTTPELRIEAPPEFAAFRARLESLDPKVFAGVLQFLGIKDPGPAIRVILAPESSDLARQTPPWIAGFAVGGTDLVVIFPARTPGYPDNSLEDVLRSRMCSSHALRRDSRFRAGSMKVLPWLQKAHGDWKIKPEFYTNSFWGRE